MDRVYQVRCVMEVNKISKTGSSYSNPLRYNNLPKKTIVFYDEKDNEQEKEKPKNLEEAQDELADKIRQFNDMCSRIAQTSMKKSGGDARIKTLKNVARCLKTAQKIAQGKKVSMKDRLLLMEMFPDLYRMAVTIGMMVKRKKREEDEERVEEEETEDQAEEDPTVDEVEDSIADSVENISSIL